MPAHSFTATPLWQATLEPRRGDDPHREQRERLRDSYMTLRDNAIPLLAENARSMPEFTVHDISHVDALWETAALVCGDQVKLNPAEAFVLGCAFVLHDAAMGMAAYGTTVPEAIGERRWRDLVSVTYFHRRGCWPGEAELDTPPAEIAEACQAQAIRETHADQARLLVDQEWRSSAGNQVLLIQNLQLREAYGPLIGKLAASHWWPVDALAEQFRHPQGSPVWQPVEWNIEPLKLACILRLADAAQVDSRRAPTVLSTLRAPQGVSRDHWRFQEHMGRPRREGDRITYTSLRSFRTHEAGSWWLALDYLRGIDKELRQVDALLHDSRRERLAVRAVAGVDSPERFAELFPVEGWRPIDATVKVSDVPGLVSSLGGEQLYGEEPEVALRELIQNAQDAVLARHAMEGEFPDGRIDVRLTEQEGRWTLEISDNGVGMDEEALVHGLLDFGTSGWSSSRIRRRLRGLADGGFQPGGRFGIGFFSVFLLGDQVELVTRRYEGSVKDARRLAFDGPSHRPLLTPLPEHVRPAPPQGTTVRVMLKTTPYDVRGLFYRTSDERLDQLVRRLVLENSVPIRIWEGNAREPEVLAPFSLATGSPDEVFDRLYPPQTDAGRSNEEKQRLQLRDAFVERATEVLDEKGHRIGLAMMWNDLHYQGTRNFLGLVTVNGFLADEFVPFAGYLAGRPSRASRDRASLVADRDQLRRWIETQEQSIRSSGRFTASVQLELANTLHAAYGGNFPEDVAIAFTAEGLLRSADVAGWAAQRDEVFMLSGPPLVWSLIPPRIYHYLSGEDVRLPPNWIYVANWVVRPPLAEAFPDTLRRDPTYEHTRNESTLTWQKAWWRMSGSLTGVFLRALCDTWSCTVEDLLAPVAERRWSDSQHLPDSTFGPIEGHLLRRPQGPS
ncbi:ATP-binding protein [Streptomyces sp. NPDC059396]|uniref:HD domain-containing protein n=1 Tax=Streptomyces sp. NPDC059396 TaxID=3346819 RepID=UPI0036C02F62